MRALRTAAVLAALPFALTGASLAQTGGSSGPTPGAAPPSSAEIATEPRVAREVLDENVQGGPTDRKGAGLHGDVGINPNAAGRAGEGITRADVREAVEQAGFTDVRVLDGMYAVRATGPDGETVTMMVVAAPPSAAR
jgi:hypothetical protein